MYGRKTHCWTLIQLDLVRRLQAVRLGTPATLELRLGVAFDHPMIAVIAIIAFIVTLHALCLACRRGAIAPPTLHQVMGGPQSCFGGGGDRLRGHALVRRWSARKQCRARCLSILTHRRRCAGMSRRVGLPVLRRSSSSVCALQRPSDEAGQAARDGVFYRLTQARHPGALPVQQPRLPSGVATDGLAPLDERPQGRRRIPAEAAGWA